LEGRTDRNVCSTKMDQRKRIAIYGGTFDPVHSGHLEIGRRVSEFFAIDEFLFMPARLAPHKVGQEAASALDRYAMLALATQDEPRLSVSRFELDGPGQQYTVDTLAHFRARCEFVDLFFVMGADSWAEITTWREWQRLVTLANLIVVTRPGHQTIIDDFAGATSHIVDLRGENMPVTVDLVEAEPPQIFVTDAVMIDVSATAVRRAVREAAGEKLEQLVPPSVADYIRKYGLYRNTNEA
jgi:nicotinate-nucleotide adenylyltransferase